jgi:hypothetical protein
MLTDNIHNANWGNINAHYIILRSRRKLRQFIFIIMLYNIICFYFVYLASAPKRDAPYGMRKGNGNFSGLLVGHNSRSFRLVKCLIIKNEMSRYIQWITNWRISQGKHILFFKIIWMSKMRMLLCIFKRVFYSRIRICPRIFTLIMMLRYFRCCFSF